MKKHFLESKTSVFFGIIWPLMAAMLNAAIDNIALLHESLGDLKYYIAVIISSGAGVILRHYTAGGIAYVREDKCKD